MKRIFYHAAPLACCAGLGLLAASCSSASGRAQAADAKNEQDPAVAHREQAGPAAYSPNTLILSLEEGVSDSDIYALATRYDMEVLYLYKNFNMCALKLSEKLSDRQFDQLFARLEQEPGVIQAMRDGIMQLDGKD